MMHKAWYSTEDVPYCFSKTSIKFQGHMDQKFDDLNPILSKITTLVAAIKSLRSAWNLAAEKSTLVQLMVWWCQASFNFTIKSSTLHFFYFMVSFLSLVHHINGLTHWGRDQIDAMSQTTFSNAFSRMKMNEFRIGFHWSLFLRFELTIFQHWFR